MHRTISRRDLFAASRPATAAPILTAELHLLARATFGATPQALAELQALGMETWIDQQLEPGSIDDTALETLLPNIVATTASTGADIRLLARAIFSKRQLAWRMVHFLNNHFSTNRPETQSVSEVQEDEQFYRHCFGSFEQVLKESATSPAMIDYLDSQVNVASAPNENYARELMELHTLGVGGGYTENDIAQIAKVFTGWSRAYTTVGTTVVAGVFRFRSQVHSSGSKSTSLGWSTPGYTGIAGANEGMSFLAFLASHPNTRLRFVTKLCQYFVADQPPAGLLARALEVFGSTAGSLRETVRAILVDPEFATTATSRAKVHDGFEFVANAVRRVGFATLNWSAMNTRVSLLRCLPHHNPVPTGYDEVGEEWQGAGNVLSRWDFIDDLVHDRITGAAVPWSALFGPTPPPTGAQFVNAMCARFLDGEVPATSVVALTVFMDARLAALPANPTWTQVRPAARALASLVLRLPEAQLH
jgi:uncharacterized protein (DUF1800 family)